MKSAFTVFVGIVIGASSGLSGIFGVQTEGKQLEAADLKTMVSNMGYAAKDLGDTSKGKFEFTITKETLDVPLGAELSTSKRFIWLTAFLGETAKMKDYSTKAAQLLAKNSEIQPSFFYTTSKGNLMMGICVENRDLTPAILRFRIDKIVGDVVSTEKLWSAN